MSDIILLSTKGSSYFADIVYDKLVAEHVNLTKLDVIHSKFPDGESYYRIDVSSNFEVLGKTAIYCCSITSDNDLLEVVRVGSTLVQLGVKRRIFIIPFLAYSTMERAVMPGEVVTAKCTIQMLSSIGTVGAGNVFLLFDLHTAGLLHYFEGPCLRLELYGQKTLMNALPLLDFKQENFMFASCDLGRNSWVNAFARDAHTPVAFIRKTRTNTNGKTETHVCEIIGTVKGYNLIIYDDMIRSGGSLIQAAIEYLNAGALSVSAMVSHLCPFGSEQIQRLIDSPIRRIVATNSHPITQHEMIQSSSKFIIVDAAPEFVGCLAEIIPKP